MAKKKTNFLNLTNSKGITRPDSGKYSKTSRPSTAMYGGGPNVAEADQGQQNFDYGNLVVSHLPKKKLIRKIMLSEYFKEYKHNALLDISATEKNNRMNDFKVYSRII